MPTHYSFKTKWEIEAPVEQVWNAIYHSLDWPQWWKGVINVTELQPGDPDGIGSVRAYTWESILPYKLSFRVRVTEIETYKRMKGEASGELEGEGEWLFREINGITQVQYNWNVITTKPWMNFLSFILKPLFGYNHNVIMEWGRQGLVRLLKTR